jgi:hypothetical protein
MGSNLMKSLLLVSPFALFTSAAFAEPDPRVWNLSEFEGRSTLAYSQPESDDVMITFSCSEGSGAVSVFVAATSEKVKTGETLDFAVTAGTAKTNLRGGASQNMMDGVPSLNAYLGSTDPFFRALAAGKGSLTVEFKGERQTAPLRSMGKKGAAFNGKCKPQM